MYPADIPPSPTGKEKKVSRRDQEVPFPPTPAERQDGGDFEVTTQSLSVLTLLERKKLLRRERESRFAHLKHGLGEVVDTMVLQIEEAEVGAGVVELVDFGLVSSLDLSKVDDEQRVALEVLREVGARVLDVDRRHLCVA